MTPLIILCFLLQYGKTKILNPSSRLRAALESDCELKTLHKEYREEHQHTRPPNEESSRLGQFREKIRAVLELREDPAVTWDVDVTFMADMTEDERDLYKTGFNDTSVDIPITLQSSVGLSAYNVPAEFDGWRQKNFVPPIKQQKKGSCWAHAAAVPLEAQLAAKKGWFEKLSVQELFDCGLPKGRHENGGWPRFGWEYVMRSGRLGLDSKTPEFGGDDTQGHHCSYYQFTFNALDGTVLTSINRIPPRDEDLKYVLSAISPVGVSVETDVSGLDYYHGGIFNPRKCGPRPDHSMVTVGYTVDYWIVRNSWKPTWGMQGHVWWTRKGKGCFLLEHARYPYLEAQTPIVQKREELGNDEDL